MAITPNPSEQCGDCRLALVHVTYDPTGVEIDRFICQLDEQFSLRMREVACPFRVGWDVAVPPPSRSCKKSIGKIDGCSTTAGGCSSGSCGTGGCGSCGTDTGEDIDFALKYDAQDDGGLARDAWLAANAGGSAVLPVATDLEFEAARAAVLAGGLPRVFSGGCDSNAHTVHAGPDPDRRIEPQKQDTPTQPGPEGVPPVEGPTPAAPKHPAVPGKSAPEPAGDGAPIDVVPGNKPGKQASSCGSCSTLGFIDRLGLGRDESAPLPVPLDEAD